MASVQNGIIPNLWFDRNAEEAVRFYARVFKNSSMGKTTHYNAEGAKVSGMPEGSVMTVELKICGQRFLAFNGGPHFQFTPAISLTVMCETEAETDQLWSQLVEGALVMMPLGQYPFSKKFGFLKDRFGLSWQINFVGQPQRIVPSFIFVGDKLGKAEEAMRFYTSIFPDSQIQVAEKYGEGEPAPKGTLKYGLFTLRSQEFIAMDGAGEHAFGFSGAISFQVDCETQAEVDHFWNAFAKGGQEQPCGWVADRYGVHWQVVPRLLGQLITDPNPKKAQRALHEMYQMKKIDLKKLQQVQAEF